MIIYSAKQKKKLIKKKLLPYINQLNKIIRDGKSDFSLIMCIITFFFFVRDKSSEINQFKIKYLIGNNILLIIYLLDITDKNHTNY